MRELYTPDPNSRDPRDTARVVLESAAARGVSLNLGIEPVQALSRLLAEREHQIQVLQREISATARVLDDAAARDTMLRQATLWAAELVREVERLEAANEDHEARLRAVLGDLDDLDADPIDTVAELVDERREDQLDTGLRHGRAAHLWAKSTDSQVAAATERALVELLRRSEHREAFKQTTAFGHALHCVRVALHAEQAGSDAPVQGAGAQIERSADRRATRTEPASDSTDGTCPSDHHSATEAPTHDGGPR